MAVVSLGFVGCARPRLHCTQCRTSTVHLLLASHGARSIIPAWLDPVGLARSLAPGVSGSPLLYPVRAGRPCLPAVPVIMQRMGARIAPTNQREPRRLVARIARQSATPAWINAAVAHRRPSSVKQSHFPPLRRSVLSSGVTQKPSPEVSGGHIPNRSRTVLPPRPSSQHRT